MATLAEAIRARDALRERYRGAAWLRRLEVSLSELGYGLELRRSGSVRERVDVDPRVPVRIVSDAYAPLSIARWHWSARPAVFDHFDRNGDGIVDEHDLDRGLGRGVSRLRDEAAGPLGPDAWQGSAHVFEALDENKDGFVARADAPRRHRSIGSSAPIWTSFSRSASSTKLLTVLPSFAAAW